MDNISLRIEELSDNKFKVSLSVPLEDKWYDDVYLNCICDIECLSFKIQFKNNSNGMIHFESIIDLPTKALYHVFISCKIDGENRFLDKNNIFSSSIDKKDMIKLSSGFKIPDCWKGKNIYHIFVDRFYKGREEELEKMDRRTIHKSLDEDVLLGPDENGIWNADFYGGDLIGIIKKLDYIKSMGCNIIYLSPIFMSQSNHRYDTGDYLKVDPYAGSMDDLKMLCSEAHKAGIKVILDGVFNHTGNDSKYFNELGSYGSDGAFNNNDSLYSKFYKKRIVDGKTYYSYWWGFKNLPECDCNSLEWQDFICGRGGVIDQWFKCGIDGLRLDVADELSDHFIELIRDACHRNNPDSFIYGEVWENPMRMGRGYVSSGKGMDSVMNYQWMDALIRYYNYGDVNKLIEKINEVLLEYPNDTINSLMNSTSTHDFSRIVTILGNPELFNYYGKWAWDLKNDNLDVIRNYKLTMEEYKRGIDKYLSYLIALGFLPGNFTIFYGDEVGVQGLGNLQNRRYFPWSEVEKFNPVLGMVKSICNMRNNNSFLSDAQFRMLGIDDRFMMYERFTDKNGILVGVSRSDDFVDIQVPSEYRDSEKVLTLKNSNQNKLNPYGGIILRK